MADFAIPPHASLEFHGWFLGFSGSARDDVVRWIESLPGPVRDLCFKYPPGLVTLVNGRLAYLISYHEVDGEPERPGFNFSFVDPAVNYDLALQTRFFICRDHLP
jgi:hypothetical protein